MAIIRRIDSSKITGYGVFGQIYQNDALVREINVLDVVAAEIPPRLVLAPGEVQPVESDVNYCSVLWRAKIQVLTADLTLADTFNTQSEKRKYGRYLYKAEDYVTHENFLSYASQMTVLGSFAYGHGKFQSKDDVPCDEPPITISSPTIVTLPQAGTSVPIASYSTIGLLSTWMGGVQMPDITPADKLLFIPESCLRSYIIGITFSFAQRALTVEQYTIQGLPPIILL